MAHDRVEKPYVAADASRYIAIVLVTGPKWVYAVTYDRYIRVMRKSRDEFQRVYRPLTAGGIPYSIQVAARKYLDWGTRAGITEVAHSALNNILQGDFSMSDVERKTATQEEAKVPSASTLGAALAEATAAPAKKSSTKQGTTAAAKRPSKAKTIQPTKETAMKKDTKPTKKSTPSTKPTKAAKKTTAPKAAKKTTAPKATKKTTAPKAAKKTNGSVSPAKAKDRPEVDVTKKIKVLVDGNPRREGSVGYENWKVIKRYDGKLVSDYLAAGGLFTPLRTDYALGHVKLV